MANVTDYKAKMDRVYNPTVGNVTVLDELGNAIDSGHNISEVSATTKIGELTSLTTDDKTKIVNAINEVDQHTDNNITNIGDLSALKTSAKAAGSLVDAINELWDDVHPTP